MLSILNVRTGRVCWPRPKFALASHTNTLPPWYHYKHPPTAQRALQTVTGSCSHILSHGHPVHLVPLTFTQPQAQTRSPQITVTATSSQIIYIPATLLPTRCYTKLYECTRSQSHPRDTVTPIHAAPYAVAITHLQRPYPQ